MRKDQAQIYLQSILDPIEPLEVTAYSKRAGRPKSLTDANAIQIMIWKAENVSNSEIGRRLHVSEKTIRRYLKSLQSQSQSQSQKHSTQDLSLEETEVQTDPLSKNSDNKNKMHIPC